MERMYWYARCEQPKPSRTLSKTEAKAKVEETRKPESRMMRQVSSTVRRGTGGKGQQWTSPAVYPAMTSGQISTTRLVGAVTLTPALPGDLHAILDLVRAVHLP